MTTERERTSAESLRDPISEVMEIQMGPSHPATHGTIKFNLVLDGESITSCDTEIGYLHRGFEKMCEQGTWTQCIPYTDRLNYASPLINNFIFAEAVERMLGVTVPERCSYIRVILSEVSRIADHLTVSAWRPPSSARSPSASTPTRLASCSTTSTRTSPARGSR